MKDKNDMHGQFRRVHLDLDPYKVAHCHISSQGLGPVFIIVVVIKVLIKESCVVKLGRLMTVMWRRDMNTFKQLG